MSTEFYLIVAIVATVLSTARLARLAVLDKFPPVKAIRDWYEDRTDGSGWQWLTMCAFCMAPWMALVVAGWGWAAGVYDHRPYAAESPWFTAWWVFNGWLAFSYAAASYVARDGANDEDA